ncbi:TetR/AcrR family transcriptional regulator [Microbulbifer spongiae]|uniref:TetR/AcrR family transcriptional regulator n=1 Tax=Microbulbifer spongiae TaxID=2944933 RepID=A0ABY9ECJ5_9GAMM|nr:TetR/AcrR family transcriptional regulator [Microbulbifer sp. MI-G]WKD49681.1 TetR/AcrR family transcriptional regulator [Microbulbifer sp. MI-G]
MRNIPTSLYISHMPRSTKEDPERGNAKARLLEAARDVVRQQGYSGTTVDEPCEAAGVTKGAFFHHCKNSEALGVAAAEFWADTTSAMLEAAPYHELDDPFERILAHLDFHRSLIEGDLAEWTCLVGTMTQEIYQAPPAIRNACADSIFGHAETLEPDIQAALESNDHLRRYIELLFRPPTAKETLS